MKSIPSSSFKSFINLTDFPPMVLILYYTILYYTILYYTSSNISCTSARTNQYCFCFCLRHFLPFFVFPPFRSQYYHCLVLFFHYYCIVISLLLLLGLTSTSTSTSTSCFKSPVEVLAMLVVLHVTYIQYFQTIIVCLHAYLHAYITSLKATVTGRRSIICCI